MPANKLKSRTCPQCGKRFHTMRDERRFCSEKCRKRAENNRLRGAPATLVAEPEKSSEIVEQNQQPETPLRGEYPLSEGARAAAWTAINEITRKLTSEGKAVGWVMYIDRQGAWFGRVWDDRGNFSFGPATLDRAQRAVEAWVKHEPLDKREGERSWMGDCLALV